MYGATGIFGEVFGTGPGQFMWLHSICCRHFLCGQGMAFSAQNAQLAKFLPTQHPQVHTIRVFHLLVMQGSLLLLLE